MKIYFVKDVIFKVIKEGVFYMSRTTNSSLTNALHILKSFSIDEPGINII